jgi:hypothetical protein
VAPPELARTPCWHRSSTRSGRGTSSLEQSDFPPGYWQSLWHWYEQEGGFRHVVAYLAQLDLSGFDAKAPPRKTAAF